MDYQDTVQRENERQDNLRITAHKETLDLLNIKDEYFLSEVDEKKIEQIKTWIEMENDAIKINQRLIYKNEILGNKTDNYYEQQIAKNHENIKKFENEIKKILGGK
jgi:hypothetical protein